MKLCTRQGAEDRATKAKAKTAEKTASKKIKEGE